jgi:hypothetical protein
LPPTIVPVEMLVLELSACSVVLVRPSGTI